MKLEIHLRNIKTVLVFAAIAASLSVASAAADDPVVTPTASQVCKDLRTQMGADAFKATYGTNKNKKNAFGKCVSKLAKTVSTQAGTAKNTCKAERAADPAAFAAKYGTNKNKKNAYGKCVSAAAKQAAAAKVATLTNAAKQCKTERTADPAAFKAKYGTNKNKSNAFGKCVSKISSAK